jgi:ATP-binding cassette subfamily E protein 1
MCLSRKADLYLLDEPSAHLDVKQRLEAAKAIRSLLKDNKTIIVAEHDLAILDYLSDYICIFYGKPGIYGIVSHVQGVRTGINIYLQGFIPDENLRFRKESIQFHTKAPTIADSGAGLLLKWGKMTKTFEGFQLNIENGKVKQGEVIGILGPNGIGKTTFVKILAGIIKTDLGKSEPEISLKVSYKPQYISANYEGTVEDLLRNTAKQDLMSGWYQTEIINPLNISFLLNRSIKELSGGELQRVAIAMCLSRKADLYLLDEPSAHLDVEERLSVARTIRRIIEYRNVAAFVVEHDVVAQDFIADRLIIFEGESGKKGISKIPTSLLKGMNSFLKGMGVTFRRDTLTKRPRVNKENSQLDRYQKKTGQYYYVK